MEQFTTYRAKGKVTGLILLFKYDLKGNLKKFEIEDGELSEAQQSWLFNVNHFPANEQKMNFWAKSKSFSSKFEVEVSPADVSFEALWNLYNYKIKRVEAEKCFKKLKEADIIKLFLEVTKYNKYMTKKTHDKAHLSTFINKRMFEDDFSKV